MQLLVIQMVKNRQLIFLGIQSTCTGSSEQAVKEWENTLKHITDLYNESPFGKRQGSLLKFIDLMIKLTNSLPSPLIPRKFHGIYMESTWNPHGMHIFHGFHLEYISSHK